MSDCFFSLFTGMLKEAEEEISRKMKVSNITLPKQNLLCMFIATAYSKVFV